MALAGCTWGRKAKESEGKRRALMSAGPSVGLSPKTSSVLSGCGLARFRSCKFKWWRRRWPMMVLRCPLKSNRVPPGQAAYNAPPVHNKYSTLVKRPACPLAHSLHGRSSLCPAPVCLYKLYPPFLPLAPAAAIPGAGTRGLAATPRGDACASGVSPSNATIHRAIRTSKPIRLMIVPIGSGATTAGSFSACERHPKRLKPHNAAAE